MGIRKNPSVPLHCGCAKEYVSRHFNKEQCVESTWRAAGLVAVIAGFVLTAGCLETETALGPVEQASVDARLVGDWKTGENDNVDVIVRNFNGREYYIEERTAGRDTVRYAGFVIAVKDASFVHVRPLEDDGTLPKKHVILRVDRLDDAKVNLRQLNDAFFAATDKPHDTTAKLRAIVEANLNNAAMYDGDESIVLTRAAK